MNSGTITTQTLLVASSDLQQASAGWQPGSQIYSAKDFTPLDAQGMTNALRRHILSLDTDSKTWLNQCVACISDLLTVEENPATRGYIEKLVNSTCTLLIESQNAIESNNSGLSRDISNQLKSDVSPLYKLCKLAVEIERALEKQNLADQGELLAEASHGLLESLLPHFRGDELSQPMPIKMLRKIATGQEATIKFPS